MRKRTHTYLTLLLVILCSGGSRWLIAQKCVPPPSDIVAWWPGDGNSDDWTGRAPAREFSASGVTYAAGKSGQAFRFADGWISLGDGAAVVGTGPFSIDAWIQTTAPVGVVINQRGTGPDEFIGEYVLSIGGGMIGTPEKPFASGPGRVCWSTYGEGDWGFNFCGNTRVDDGQWHHIAAVRESGGTGKIYVDGEFDGIEEGEAQPLIKVATYLGADVRQGSHDGDPWWTYYTGLLDEVHIFGHALAPAEIRAIYSAGAAGLCKTAKPPQTATARSGGTEKALLRRDCVPPPPDMVWPAEGALDTLMARNNFVTSGVTFAAGKVGRAFQFSDGWISLGKDAAVTGDGPFTVDTWIKTESPSGVLINQRGTGRRDYDGEYVLSVGGGIPAGGAGQFAWGPGCVCWSTYGQRKWGFNFCSKLRVDDGRWHHIAAVRADDGAGRIYIDGKLDRSMPGSSVTLQRLDVYLGADAHNGSAGYPYFYYKGLLDGVHVFARALSIGEIQAIHSAGSPGICMNARVIP